jgi:signal transduction histidine kinase
VFKRIVEQSDWIIWFEKELEVGTAFSVIFPLFL